MRPWLSHRDREPAVEALSDGPTASGARATVANDIFSDTKVRNARAGFLLGGRSRLSRGLAVTMQIIFSCLAVRDLSKSLRVRNHCGLPWLAASFHGHWPFSNPAVLPLGIPAVLPF